MSDANTPGPFDGQDDVTTDLACRHCGYNLRGLRRAGNCPECNTPIEMSLRGNLLQYADPAWVETVSKGLTIILWMILVWFVAAIVGGFLAVATSPVFGLAIFLVAQIGNVYGVWLMTEPDPSGVGEDPNLTARKVVRIALLIGVVSQVLTLIDEGLRPGGAVSVLLGLAAGLCVLVSLVGEFAKYIFYEQIALRIPEDKLAQRARFLRWPFTISFGLMLFLQFLTALLTPAAAGPAPGPAPAAMTVACLMIPVGLAVLIFSLMTIVMLFSLRKHVKLNAEYARANWNKAVADNEAAPPPAE